MEDGLTASRSPQTEISAISKILRVVRFASSSVHQPMEETDVGFFVRTLNKGRLGYASVNGLDSKALAAAVKQAEEMAALPAAPLFMEKFAEPAKVADVNGFAGATRDTGTDRLIERAKGMFRKANGTGATQAGVFWTVASELAVMNSNGVKLYHPVTAANCQAVTTKGELTGYAQQAAPDVDEIDPEKVADESLHRALRFGESRELPPGDYTCLLEEYAVAELLFFLAYMAFTAEAVDEGKSVIGSRKGERIADSNVTIWDDGLDSATFQIPFDVEGVPRKKVVFIDKGIAGDVVYDLMTARQFKTKSTGHALPFHYSSGPFPLNLEMAAGDATREEMLSKIKRGLLVTRFHYIREVHPLKTMVTGMTRDGLFLVENGEIVARVKNLRFTESILKAFSKVLALSKQRKLLTSGEADIGIPAGVCAPKALVESFSFTGATNF